MRRPCAGRGHYDALARTFKTAPSLRRGDETASQTSARESARSASSRTTPMNFISEIGLAT